MGGDFLKVSNLFKILAVWFIFGMCYFTLEGIWRIPKGGYANISMLFVGGLCGLLVGSINQVPRFYNMAVWKQAGLGTVIVLVVEYVSGYVLNIKLGLDIWDYSDMYFILNGQICLEFAVLWFLLMPAAVWLEDFVRWTFWREGVKYGLKDVYGEFFCGE